ncbi:MAG: glycosyltransferase [Flavobacteriales bacterium]|jgi:glycosyltransferase involved in cell wall biosynthesis
MNTSTSLKSDLVKFYPISVEFSLAGLDLNLNAQSISAEPEILFVSSFPPRECGIATYTEDLIIALENQFNRSFKCSVCALETNTESLNYTREPKYILNTERQSSFWKTSFLIRKDPSIDLVVVQHEFGFFHGHEMDFYIWLEALDKPVAIVFHTVLPKPFNELLKEVNVISYLASYLIVMTQSAAEILVLDYGIDRSHIEVIAHGCHTVAPMDKQALKLKYHLRGKKVLATFGLLSSGKGVETALKGLPSIIKLHPEVIFLVLGKTHPSVVKKDGEQYREFLMNLVKELEIEDYVRFVNSYLPLEDLLEYLQICDVYLFTTRDPLQAVSGTFSYAVSAGCPIVSTRIPHALEVLNDSNGVFIDFDSYEQLGNAVNELLDDVYRLEEMSASSQQKMASVSWPNSAIKHAMLFQKVSARNFTLHYNIPLINLDHIKRMTDDFGMFQFAIAAKPDVASGYTLDDNARALISICQHFALRPNASDLRLIETYINFIDTCFVADGVFLNYISKYRKFSGQNYNENIEDSTGRAIWALGVVASLHGTLPSAIVELAEDLLDQAMDAASEIYSTRAMAFMIKGLYYENNPKHKHYISLFADRLFKMYLHEKEKSWNWFEGYLTYGNALLPEALLFAYVRTGVSGYLQCALESFDFLIGKIYSNGRLRIISNNGWHQRGDEAATFFGGEQPIDVAYTILAMESFYSFIDSDRYRELAILAFEWFLGNNHLHQMVYNPITGGCQDGVEADTINMNQGAESTVSYLLARLSIQRIDEQYTTRNQGH